MVVAAFFDVDETIINVKSMFDFLHYFSSIDNNINYKDIINSISKQSREGISRESINLEYWKIYSGLKRETVLNAIQQWFTSKINNNNFFIKSTIERLKFHQEQKHIIVFVSGSGKDILSPLSKFLKVDHILATELICKNGYYTGDIIPPIMIGDGKAISAKLFAKKNNVNLLKSFAYADHISDIPLLKIVGNPIVVGDSPQMIKYAKNWDWNLLND